MDPPATRVEQDLPDAGREPPWTWSLAVGLVAFALYLALAPRAIGDGDAGELTLVLALAGAAHPPGYPLYTVFGHAWVIALHALGASWARAGSSWSALGGALAIAAFHALAARLVPRSPGIGARGRALVALAPCALLALHPVWTREVTVAGVNGWTLALVIVMAAVTERWLAGLARGGAPVAPARSAWTWGALCGIALTQHPTTMFVAAPLSLALAMVARLAGVRARTAWLALGVTIGVAVACDLFIVWRAFHPAAGQWPLLEPTLASVTSHVRGTLYLVHPVDFAATSADRALLATTVLPALIPGLLALWFAARHIPNLPQRVLHGALLIASTLGIAFAFTFGVLEPVVYLLPALAFSLLGITAMTGWLAARLRRPIVLAPLALVVVVLGWFWIGEARGRARRLEAEDEALHARWRALPIEHGIVVWTTDDHMRLVAWQVLAGEHPAVTVVDPAVLTWPAPRYAFERRFGFDPLAGLTLRADAGLSDVGPNIARQTGLPVIDFDEFRP